MYTRSYGEEETCSRDDGALESDIIVLAFCTLCTPSRPNTRTRPFIISLNVTFKYSSRNF